MENRSFLVNANKEGELNIIEFINGGETLRMHPETGENAKRIVDMLLGSFKKGENNA